MLFIYHPDQTDETNKKTKERKKSKTPSNQTTFEIDDKKDDENLWCKHSNKSNTMKEELKNVSKQAKPWRTVEDAKKMKKKMNNIQMDS